MFPSYARIKSFDETHTNYALKYALYLYREQGLDPVPEKGHGFSHLTGVPALFIPGNAGSYRQVRSIAAECANLYFGEESSIVKNPNKSNYDFFTADFNEDFTAFHGRTLLDQSEYLNHAIKFILLLYQHRENPPTSVVILAHSMGGIVARVMVTLDSYVSDSINTIVTLASPHSAAPLTFDGDILKVYLAADRFWIAGFNSNSLDTEASRRLHNISLISITGGALDSVLPADYTSLGFLVPPSNGFTVYSTGIPDVWTSMDHLAIVWCNQLRRQILRVLMEIIDSSVPQKTYDLKKRMEISSDILLSGFEGISRKVKSSAPGLVNLKTDIKDTYIHNGPEYIWKSNENVDQEHAFILLPISVNSTVLLLNDRFLDSGLALDLSDYFGIFLCKNGQEVSTKFDFTSLKTKEFMELGCLDVSNSLRSIPRSTPDVSSAVDSSLGSEKRSFQALQFSGNDLLGFESLLIVDRRKQRQSFNEKASEAHGSKFLIVQTSDSKSSNVRIPGDMSSLIRNGAELSMLACRPLSFNINIPGAWSSILAYRVRIKQQSGTLFSPFIRQWSDDPYETKWIVNIKKNSDLLIYMHGIAPYTPFARGKLSAGLNLELWSDPEGGWSDSNVAAVQVVISIDWCNSLKLLVLRYRIAIVSFCFSVAVACFLFQYIHFQRTGKFLGFIYGMSCLTEMNVLLSSMLILAALTPIVKLRAVQTLLNLIDPVVLQDRNEINLSLNENYTLNSFFLGLEETPLFFAGPLFYIIAIGVNFLLYHVIVMIGYVIVAIGQVGTKLARSVVRSNTPGKVPGHSGMGRKLVMTIIVLTLVLFYLPYQFTFMVSFTIQAINCVKILWNKAPASLWNFHVSFLIIMLWVLPINVPVLIVFVHNMALRWTTPFSSHHNFLAVAPILILTELFSFFTEYLPFGKFSITEPQPQQDPLIHKITLGLLGYTIGYSLVYGVRHTYWIHHLFNFWCGWLILIFFNQLSPAKQYKHH